MSTLPSAYYDKNHIVKVIESGDHRRIIGGNWDTIGQLQLEFLIRQGLKPSDKLLDIGCGSLRLGVKAVPYLDEGNYWGTDLNESLLSTGYEKEIVPSGFGDRLSRSHLIADGEFEFPNLPTRFDFAIAQSVFTHLPLNHLRLCLSNLGEKLDAPCTFFFTVFIAPDNSVTRPCRQTSAITTFPHKDPYHYIGSDLFHAASGTKWKIEYLGEWGHPVNQKIVKATFR